MKTKMSRMFGAVLMCAALVWPFQQAAAGMVSTEEVVSQSTADAARERVRAQLQRSELRKDLVALGVDPDAALGRVGAMTDAEVVALAGKIERAAAGGALSTTDLLLIIILVLVIAIAL